MSATASNTNTILVVYVALCWFLGLGGTLDVLLTSPKRFRAAGLSKMRWFLIELGGTPFLGVFTFTYYRLTIRPRLGGEGARWRTSRFVGAAPRSRGPGTESSGGGGGTMTCSGCAGRGQITCSNFSCVRGRSRDSSGREVTCPSCRGLAGSTCPACKGTGKQ